MSINIGTTIKEARKKRKMTQKQLAEELKKSERMIQKYENNEVTPSFDIMKQISEILNTNIHEPILNDAINTINEAINEEKKEIKNNKFILNEQRKDIVLNENIIKKWFFDDIKALIEETLKADTNLLRYNRNDFTEAEIEEIGYFVYLAYNTKINEILSRKNTSENEYDKGVFKY